MNARATKRRKKDDRMTIPESIAAQARADEALPVPMQEDLARRRAVVTEGAPADSGLAPEKDERGCARMITLDQQGALEEDDGCCSPNEIAREGKTLYVRYDLAQWWAGEGFDLGRMAERDVLGAHAFGDDPTRRFLYGVVEEILADEGRKSLAAHSVAEWSRRLAVAIGQAAEQHDMATPAFRWAMLRLAALAVAAAEGADRAMLVARDPAKGIP